MWLMLQQGEPEDFVIATGQQYSVREFVQRAGAELGATVRFEGSGVDEIGIVEHVANHETRMAPGDVIVRVDPRYFRPTEVDLLLGDASKARQKLGWTPRTSFDELVRIMCDADRRLAAGEARAVGV
jgi:GDPmannose 4,6-dehydratase